MIEQDFGAIMRIIHLLALAATLMSAGSASAQSDGDSATALFNLDIASQLLIVAWN